MQQWASWTTLALALHMVSSKSWVPGPALVQVNDSVSGAFCQQGIATGSQVHMCSLVTGYPQGSAADLFMASRFADFARGGSPWTTDPNIGGMLADLALNKTSETARLDARKKLVGTAQRLPNSLGAIPSAYLDAATMFSVMSAPAGGADALSGSTSSVEQLPETIAWAIDDPQYVDNYLSLLNFGSLARTLTIGDNINWANIRVGNYRDDRGKCVTLLRPVHPWFDEQGWGDAEDCESTETFVFDSYFPQAYLDLDAFALLSDSAELPDSASPFSWAPHAVVYDLLPPGQVSTTGWRSMAFASSALNMGRTVYCPPAMFANVVTSAARGNTCSAYYQGQSNTMFSDEQDILDGNSAVLQFGGAMIVAWNLTEIVPATTTADGHLSFGTYAWSSDIDAINLSPGQPDKFSDPYAIMQNLVNLAVTADWPGALPWCDFEHAAASVVKFPAPAASSSSSSTVSEYAQLAYVRTPDVGVHSLYDCAALWPMLKWGRPGPPLRRVAARTGADIFEVAKASWANVTLNTGYYTASAGTGFANYPSLTASAVEAAIDTVRLTAATALDAYVNLQLATSDYTLTLAGAAIAVSVTLVALIAGYLGRRELVRFFSKCRAGVAWAKAVSIAITAFAVITYPVMVIVAESAARASNPSARTSDVYWMVGDASGYGSYKIPAVMTMTARSVYSDAAYVIIWVNLAMAAVCTLAICVSIARLAAVEEIKYPLLPVRRASSVGSAPSLRPGHTVLLKHESQLEACGEDGDCLGPTS